MKEIERFDLYFDEMRLSKDGFWCKYRDVLKLQARIKELESDKHINEIKAQGIEEAVKKADGETYIGLPNQCFPPQKQYKAELLCYAEQLRTKHEQLQKIPIKPTHK